MEDMMLYSSLAVLLLAVAFKFLLQTRTKRKRLPPSPPSLPIIGHLHLLKKPLHRTYHDLSQKYGDIFSLRFGPQVVVIVSSPSAVEECFIKNDIIFANRPRVLLSQHLGYDCTTVAAASYGDHWRNLRRIGALEIYSTNRINVFLGIRQDEVKNLLRNLSRNSLQGFAKVALRPLFSEMAFNIIVRMVAGKRYYGEDVKDDEEAKEFRALMKEMAATAGASNPQEFVPLLRWIDIEGLKKRVIRLTKRADAFLQGLIDEKRSKDANGNTMIDHLLSLQKSQPEYYTDTIIKGLVLVMLTAGTDTAAVTLEWIMSSLLNHSQVMKKIRVEVDNQVGQEKLIDEPDVSKMHYLQNIILETLRLYPPAPMLLPHFSSEDCTIRGYDLPRGTMLLVNIWTIQRDPNLWDDATSFKPERFESRGNDIYKLMPFGLGRRACPGNGLAHRVLNLALGSLIQCFDWERISEEEVDMMEGSGVTVNKVVPLEAMCRARPVLAKALSMSEDEV